MKVQTVNVTRTPEPPRSTAYYYADLERIKRRNQENHISQQQDIQNNELSEYVEANEVINDSPVVEVPPFRDRFRQLSLPEYNSPEITRKEETYSTAGTFPMPEPKEKEPLLAELEVVGRLPLTQLDNSSGVRRSRSWYLCCPNVGDEEMSRESSWRYSSLRTVTAPPLPGQNGMHIMVATQSSGRDELAALRAERDALARALAAERQRAATAARAHDARLAELHGVIAELVRRRAHDKHAGAILEEEVSDECESTTQPAEELENDNDVDRSRTEQNDLSSLVSPEELPNPQEPKADPVDDTTDTSAHENEPRLSNPRVELTPAQSRVPTENCDTSLNLSERDSEICLSTARCCQFARQIHGSVDSCDRQYGSAESRLYTPSADRVDSRQAKIASRVKLRRTEDTDSNNHLSNEESWCADAAEKLAMDVCAQADLREALVAASNDESRLSASVCVLRARCARLQADCRVFRCALDRATDTAHRMSVWSAAQESSCVALCGALRAADRALETYDVLLALAETAHSQDEQRSAAERVGRQLLARLEAEQVSVRVGDPLLSPGPWLQHDHNQSVPEPPWDSECEARLRAHAARLKAETVTLRDERPPPHFFTYYDVEDDDVPKSSGSFNMAEMEAAVTMQEVFEARERRAMSRLSRATDPNSHTEPQLDGTRGRRRRERHWLDTQASETDL